MGVGLKWGQESATLEEARVSCLDYGLYNPFNTNVTGTLQATGDLDRVAVPVAPVAVSKFTPSTSAVTTRLCFDVPRLYREECRLGPYFCSRACQEPPVTYAGDVAAVAAPEGSRPGTGSAVAAQSAAPLRITVACRSHGVDTSPERNGPVYGGLLLAIGIAGWFGNQRRKPPEVRRKLKAEKLKRKLEGLEKRP
ncbi:MAG: hypothetical protein HY558_07025 [Euryarchaeota archaeon]|nr:hypothetical protein [Euryarchaeota archaeon]